MRWKDSFWDYSDKALFSNQLPKEQKLQKTCICYHVAADWIVEASMASCSDYIEPNRYKRP